MGERPHPSGGMKCGIDFWFLQVTWAYMQFHEQVLLSMYFCLRQELKKCKSSSVWWKVFFLLVSGSYLQDEFRMNSGWLQDDSESKHSESTQKALRKYIKNTQRAIRERESNQTLSYYRSLKYFVLFLVIWELLMCYVSHCHKCNVQTFFTNKSTNTIFSSFSS